jgi:hypothetical protein
MEAQIAELQERLDNFRKENEELRLKIKLQDEIYPVIEYGKCSAVFKNGKCCAKKGDHLDNLCEKHYVQYFTYGKYHDDCIAISENGEPCSETAFSYCYGFCWKHFKFYKEKSFEIVEPITYNIIKKIPFPLDVSIKILNLANSKIEIDDMIKYKISPSKLSINPFHKGKLEELLENRIPRFDANKNIWRLIRYLISVDFHPAEKYYTYRFGSNIYTYKM